MTRVQTCALPIYEEESTWTEQQKLNWETVYKNYVAESEVTKEIEEDLHRLGWVVIRDRDDSNL